MSNEERHEEGLDCMKISCTRCAYCGAITCSTPLMLASLSRATSEKQARTARKKKHTAECKGESRSCLGLTYSPLHFTVSMAEGRQRWTFARDLTDDALSTGQEVHRQDVVDLVQWVWVRAEQ